VDPPYLAKGASYIYDFQQDDHQRLAETLRRFRHARVVVSYYEHPELDRLYPGWTKRVIEVSKAMAHQGARTTNDTKAQEALLINGPSLVQSSGLFQSASTDA
jgi:DNA adenine methylase